MGQSGRRGRDEKLELLARHGWAAAATDDDRRWLGRVGDEVRAAAGSVVARQARPARWRYLVLAGEVRVGGDVFGSGACVAPTDADVVAASPAVLIAVPGGDEAELRRRFPRIDDAVEPAPAHLPHCPISGLLARRQPVASR